MALSILKMHPGWKMSSRNWKTVRADLMEFSGSTQGTSSLAKAASTWTPMIPMATVPLMLLAGPRISLRPLMANTAMQVRTRSSSSITSATCMGTPEPCEQGEQLPSAAAYVLALQLSHPRFTRLLGQLPMSAIGHICRSWQANTFKVRDPGASGSA